jgi:hypothetical protein
MITSHQNEAGFEGFYMLLYMQFNEKTGRGEASLSRNFYNSLFQYSTIPTFHSRSEAKLSSPLYRSCIAKP